GADGRADRGGLSRGGRMKGETVRDVGEFGLIEALRQALPKKVVESRRLRVGIGDDAAVWHQPRDESVLVTTDSLVEGIHFRLDWPDWRSLGHKALAVNVSDIAAMGGVPKLATVTLGLRGTERVADLQSLYRGLGALAAKQNMLVAGGDLVASPHCLAIHVTAIGTTRWRGRDPTPGGAPPRRASRARRPPRAPPAAHPPPPAGTRAP